MAYLNWLASVPVSEIERLRIDPSFVVTPSLVLGVSHLIGYWVQTQSLGSLLGKALDGGRLIHPELWHPLRAPLYQTPELVMALSQELGDAWKSVVAARLPDDNDWLALEVGRLLRVFHYAPPVSANASSVLWNRLSVDEERAKWVQMLWEAGRQ